MYVSGIPNSYCNEEATTAWKSEPVVEQVCGGKSEAISGAFAVWLQTTGTQTE